MRRRRLVRWLVAGALLGPVVAGCTDGAAQSQHSSSEASTPSAGPSTPAASSSAALAGTRTAEAPTPAAARGMRLAFADSFGETGLDSGRWNTCHWWDPQRCTIASNDELEWYEPGQVQVRDGRLLLTADQSTAADRDTHPYVSGMVTTGSQEQHSPAKYAFTYGYVEVRFVLPHGRGLWPAVWMLPASTSSVPEIDLLEVIGQEPNTWRFHLHPADRQRDSPGYAVTRPGLGNGSHTIGLDWRPNRLRWYVDGRQVWEVQGQDIPSEPMYLVMNLAVGGEYPGRPDGSTRFPATFTIESVRVWQ